jgi:hypothetical protein
LKQVVMAHRLGSVPGPRPINGVVVKAATARRDTNDTKSMASAIAKKWKEVMVLELPHVR